MTTGITASMPMALTLVEAIAGRDDEALHGIRARYGARTADFVAMQLEYPRPGVTR